MYNAIITKLGPIRDHSNADRLKLTTCWGNQIIIGLNDKEGDWGVYFPTDGQLSEDFAIKNDLIRRKDADGKPAGGMFDENRRIRTQKFRGEVSDGFWCPIKMFEVLFQPVNIYEDHVTVGGQILQHGTEFSSINGVVICQKYITQKTKTSGSHNQAKAAKRAKSKMFKEHFETGQFGPNLHKIPLDAFVVITEKEHGCVDQNTLIDTLEFGTLTIGEIVKNRLQCSVKSYNIQTNTIVWAEVSDYYYYADDNDWYELELENGVKLIITGNNPIWLPNQQCYRKVEDLKIGDEILFN